MISLGTPQLLCPLLGQFLDAPYTVCHRFPARLSPGYPQQSPAQGPTLNSLPLPRHTPYSRTLPPCITAHRNTCTDCSVVKTPSSQGRRHGFDPWSGKTPDQMPRAAKPQEPQVLSPCAPEPRSCRQRSHCRGGPHSQALWPALAANGEALKQPRIPSKAKSK